MNVFPETLQFSIPFIFVLILVFVSALLSYTVYKKTNPDNCTILRVFMGALRALLLLFLFILFFSPSLFTRYLDLKPKKIALFVDYSASMGLKNNSENRADSTQNKVASIENLLASENAVFDKAYFNENVITNLPDTSLKPFGLSDFSVLERFTDDKNYDQIIIVSDGIRTAGEIPEFSDTDVFTVGIGKTETEADVFIVNVDYDPLVYQNEDQQIQVRISNKNATSSARINVFSQNKLLASKLIEIDKSNADQDVDFVYALKNPGVQTVKVEIVPEKTDANVQNNIFSFTQKVVKNKIRVGVFSSVLNYEHKFIKLLLSQEKSIDVYSYLSIRNRKLSSFPIDSLDVLILQDYPSQNTSTDELNSIKNQLNLNNPGLIVFLDNAVSTNLLEQFAAYLPVSDFAPLRGNDSYPVKPIETTIIQPILRLYDDGKLNTSFWQSVPPVEPFFDLTGLKKDAKPILEYERPQGTLYAAVLYESATLKSIILNGLGFWRWHFLLIDKTDINDGYGRFLTNMVKWSANKSKFKPVALNLNKETVHPGENVIFQAKIFDAQNEIIKNGQVTIKAVFNKQEFTIAAVQDSNGNHSASYTPTEEGSYTFTASGFSNGVELGTDTKRVEVIPYSREFIETRQDTTFLQTLASKNNGMYFNSKNISQLKDHLDFSYNKIFVENEIELRLKTWFLILILGLAVFEWVLRKKNNLI